MMDERGIRERAEAHGRAVVEGNMARAAADLSDDVRPRASSIMKRLPSPLHSAAVESVEAAADGYVADIRYAGGNETVTVRSRWADLHGRPCIVDLEVV